MTARTPRDRHAEDRFFLARVKRHEAAGAGRILVTMLARNAQTWRRIAIARALTRLGVVTSDVASLRGVMALAAGGTEEAAE